MGTSMQVTRGVSGVLQCALADDDNDAIVAGGATELKGWGGHLCHCDAEQAFVQSDIEGGVFMRLPQGCGDLSDVQITPGSLSCVVQQAQWSWHGRLNSRTKHSRFRGVPRTCMCAALDCMRAVLFPFVR